MTKKSLSLEQLFETATTNAKRIFDHDHEVFPIWHAVAGNGDNLLIATPWSDDDEKDFCVQKLRKLFVERNVKRFAFVCEAWVVQFERGEHALHNEPRPSEHPDRREVLQITVQDRDGSHISGHYFILRPEHGEPTLSPLHRPDYDHVTGHMMDLFT